MQSKLGTKDEAMARLIANRDAESGAKVRGIFHTRCIAPDGTQKWEDISENEVVTEGLNHLLDILFKSDASAISLVDPWYVWLTDGTPTVASADTLASHGGWTEITAYTGDRKEYVDVRTNQTVSNAASKASFAIDTNSQTLGGAFLASVNTGTGGILLCAVAFTGGDKSADSGDTLEVTYTFAAADS